MSTMAALQRAALEGSLEVDAWSGLHETTFLNAVQQAASARERLRTAIAQGQDLRAVRGITSNLEEWRRIADALGHYRPAPSAPPATRVDLGILGGIQEKAPEYVAATGYAPADYVAQAAAAPPSSDQGSSGIGFAILAGLAALALGRRR